MSTVEPLRIFLVAGEPSGDALGSGLVRALRAAEPNIAHRGVGGLGMAEAGMDQVFGYDDLAVMGLFEVLPRYFRIRRRWHEAMDAIRAFNPDVLVTIDSSGFNKPLVRQWKNESARGRAVAYVAPMVWAWRPGRAKKMAALYDRLLCLFPFEPAWFEPYGLASDCIGHPAAEMLPGDGRAFRARHDIPADAPLLAVLPGSRRGEVARLLPPFCKTIEQLKADQPKLQLVCPSLPLVAGQVRAATATLGLPVTVVEAAAEKVDAFAAADAALAASGTVTLELALAGLPMVVAYRVNPLTAVVGKHLLSVTSASLPNLLAGRKLVPELLQGDCTPEKLAVATLRLFSEPTERATQINGFSAIAESLRPTPGRSSGELAAAIVLTEARRARGA